MDSSWFDVVTRLTTAGIKVVALRDTPRMEFNVPHCVEQNAEDVSRCGVPVSAALNETSPAEELPVVEGLSHLDFSDLLCPSGFCQAVIGNVMVYMDNDHLTASYLGTLTDLFAERFDQAVAAGA